MNPVKRRKMRKLELFNERRAAAQGAVEAARPEEKAVEPVVVPEPVVEKAPVIEAAQVAELEPVAAVEEAVAQEPVVPAPAPVVSGKKKKSSVNN